MNHHAAGWQFACACGACYHDTSIHSVDTISNYFYTMALIQTVQALSHS